MSTREDRLADARDWAREILHGDGFGANGQPIEDDEDWSLPLHRSGDRSEVERCGTCEGGGCYDCTDPA